MSARLTAGTAEPRSLTANVAAFEAGAPVVGAAFVDGLPALALGDGLVLFDGVGAARRVGAHPDGAVLVCAARPDALVTGGDDGRVVETFSAGESRQVAHEAGKWIDALALRADGAIAWSSGKQVFARDARGVMRGFSAPSTVRGLAFLPKGYRLALSHYNGATLWFPNAGGPEELVWKGSHLEITISPDSRFVVTSMQENALHAWRLSDRKDLRLSGYPAKPRSLSWSHDGKFLATSGAEAAIVWPFDTKDGPLNKAPRELGARNVRVSAVAFHPQSPILAQGYEDGMVMLCRQADGAELLVRAGGAKEDPAISALAWDKAGRRLLFGAVNGEAGVLTMPA